MTLDILKNIDVVRGIFSSSITYSAHTKHEEISPLTTQNISIEQGLDFILGHFKDPIWPRRIFTKTIGKQISVYSKQEAIIDGNIRIVGIPDFPWICGEDLFQKLKRGYKFRYD